MPNNQKGKPVHCSEIITGRGLTGTLLISDDELRVDLFSYTESFHIETDDPIHLIAETGKTISLHACVDGGSGRTYNHERTTYHQGLIANIAVVGHDAWTAGDKVRSVSFNVTHSMELLRHRQKIEEIGKTRYPEQEHLEIFEGCAKGMIVKASYGGTWGMNFNTPVDLWPIFQIEFDEPQGVHEYIRHVSNYVHFLSFCLGVKLKPHAILIHRLSKSEAISAVEAGTYQAPHEVHYVWPETKNDSHDLWVGGSPVRAWDDHELTAFRACLVTWMNRSDEWKKPYVLMMSSFALKNVISAERLINACRWFEELPNAKSKIAMTQADIRAIADVATAKAQELGHDPEIRERIETAVMRVKEETSAERFRRLVALLEKKFGKNIFPENAANHLKRAIQFRGKAAHGHFNPESDEEYRAFCKSILAMEALCYLLIALDLPITQEGLNRVRNNPVLRDYSLSY